MTDKTLIEKQKSDLDNEQMKHLFPPKGTNKLTHTDINKDKQDIKNKLIHWYEQSKYNGVIDKIVWSITGLIVLIGGALFFYSKKIDQNLNNERIAVERVYKDYIILDQIGPKPFLVSIKDPDTQEEYRDIKISNECKNFDKKSYVGEKMKLMRFTLVKINDENDKNYYFKGVEERICNGQSFTPDTSNNFYIN